MPSKKSPLPFSQKDIRLFLRILPLLKSWKLVLLFIVVAFVVQYARSLADKKPADPKPPAITAGEKSDRDSEPDDVSTDDEPPSGKSSPTVTEANENSSPELTEAESPPKTESVSKPDSERPPGILDLTDLPEEMMRVPGMVIKDLSGKVVYRGTVDLLPTLERIEQGKKLSFPHDGTVFGNRERRLPRQARDHYREWVHPTKGLSGPGPQRVVTGQNREIYYTPDHYETFKKIR